VEPDAIYENTMESALDQGITGAVKGAEIGVLRADRAQDKNGWS